MPTLNNLTIYHRTFIEYLAKENSITSAKALREKIVFENPKLNDLAFALNPKKVIRDLRIQRMPICERSGGYFYARTIEDLEEYILKIEDKAEEIVVNRLKASAGNVGYPERLVFTLFWDLPTRTERNTIAMEQFEIDVAGLPINTRGLEIMK